MQQLLFTQVSHSGGLNIVAAMHVAAASAASTTSSVDPDEDPEDASVPELDPLSVATPPLLVPLSSSPLLVVLLDVHAPTAAIAAMLTTTTPNKE